MTSEEVTVDVRLDKDLETKLFKLTKKELIEKIIIAACEAKVATEEVKQIKTKMGREIKTLQTKLDKAESYVEQGRSMIEAVMERWYEYDT